jgi:hypothetical protein
VNRLIFVSCGQLTAEERRLGQLIKAEVDAVAGFEAYFADTVQSLSALAEHILDALRRCVGAIAVLHQRGRVMSAAGDELGVRSSVWINQEIAILAYRQFFERSNIPILAFADPSLTHEGAMTAFILNPKPLGDEEAVVSAVRQWLRDLPISHAGDLAVFAQKWRGLTKEDRAILASLIAEGVHEVKELSIRGRLIQDHGFDKNRASTILMERRLALSSANLVQLRHNIYDGDEMSLHPSWEALVRYEIGRLSQNAGA